MARRRPRRRPRDQGRIEAGTLSVSLEPTEVAGLVDQARSTSAPSRSRYVVVRGDSMSSVGYRTGDIIAINRTLDAAEGDVVMACIGTEVTVKCFHRPADDRVELKPCSSNPEHRPIVINERTEDWEIVGVVVGAMIRPPRQGLAGR